MTISGYEEKYVADLDRGCRPDLGDNYLLLLRLLPCGSCPQ